ncbi:MAG: hypothetical protein HY727_13225 [Candidatus Rokubacteria bacterium]|nr:hypothetical protein [Candidatus Rokubacteria bacterium]
MLTVLGIATVVLIPFLSLLALMRLADRRERARQEVVARQVAVTDAIHRELGAVVSPVVRKRPWGPWQVRIALPRGRRALAGSVLSITHGALASASGARGNPLEVLLVSRDEGGR